MQRVSPLDIFLISSQVIDFYWIMLAKGFSMRHSKQSTGEVEVDLGRYELRRSGRRIKIEKKPMDLLIFLLERREQMVCGSFAPRWVTTPKGHAFLKRSSAKDIASSAGFG
jgi:hypothetical protein